MEHLVFWFGFVMGLLVSMAIGLFMAYKFVSKWPNRVEFKSLVPDNIINKPPVYTTGGKHIPKVRDDNEARKQEIKKSDEEVLKYGQ